MKYTLIALFAWFLLGCTGATSRSGIGASNGDLNMGTYNYAGTWSGPLELNYTNPPMTIICQGEFQFSQPTGQFVVEYGMVDCSGQTETWPRTVLTDSNGQLTLNGNIVGRRGDDKINITLPGDPNTIYFEVTPTSANGLNHVQEWTETSSGNTELSINGPLTRN